MMLKRKKKITWGDSRGTTSKRSDDASSNAIQN